MIELHTERVSELADITAATLEERTTGEGVLRLEFAGFGPDWLQYMEPVSLYHAGRLVFHGKVTACSRSNEGGTVRAAAEVHNFFWLLERQTLGQQLAELAEAGGSGSGTAGTNDGRGQEVTAFSTLSISRMGKGQIGKNAAQKHSGGGYWVSWDMAVANMRTSAPGWTVLPKAGGYSARAVAEVEALGSLGAGDIAVECSAGVAGRQMWAVTDKLITTASALWRMRRKAQDVQYIVDYAGGTVTATGIGELPRLVLDTADGAVLSAADISPQWDAAVTGVVIVWTNDIGQTEVHKWPPQLDEAADGVKVFSLSGTYYVESWDAVAREYYDAANVLSYGGTVTLLASKLAVSPLGRRLCLTGAGTHESWHAMDAVVTSCTWDLLEGTVTAALGRDVADPEFAEAAETEDGGDYVEEFERHMSGDAAGNWPFLSNNGSDGGYDGGGGGGGSASAESKYRVEQVSLREPDGCAPGVDGWVQTLFLQGSLDWQEDYAYTYRQLMRFVEDGDKVILQVCTQRRDFDTNEWLPI